MKRHLSFSMIAAALAFAATPDAQAATLSNGSVPAPFVVSLTLNPSCSISAAPLTFPATGGLTAAVPGKTSLSVTCTNMTSYEVGLDGGTVAGSTVANRLMAGSNNNKATVGFGLYQDAAGTTAWGNTPGTDTLAGTGTGSAQSIPVYGQVPIQPTPMADTYQTTITATVYF